MDSNQFNKWLNSLANVGVLLGLAVLIVEIRQNNELTMAQIEQSRSESFLAWSQEWVTNDHIAPLRAKMFKLLYDFADRPINELTGAERGRIGKLVFDNLDPVERQRAFDFYLRSYWDFETLFYQHKRGLISDEYWEQRIVPAIVIDGVVWKIAGGGALPLGRTEFNLEVERILEATK